MKLITFQPLQVMEQIESKGKYIPKNKELLGQRVFCIKLDKNTMENLYATAPAMPQVLIELDVDDSKVEVLDYIEWANYINGHKRKYTGKYADKVKYKEYALEFIDKKDVVGYTIISKSDDPDEVQDAYQDYHYEELEKLSGCVWRRSHDKEMKAFWKTPEAYYFVRCMHQYMMPQETLTDEQADELHNLIKQVFIAK